MKKFFGEPGLRLYPLSKEECEDVDKEKQRSKVKQFHEVLRMFNNLEALLESLQESLYQLQKFDREMKKLNEELPGKMNEGFYEPLQES